MIGPMKSRPSVAYLYPVVRRFVMTVRFQGDRERQETQREYA
jgi:hypothetical protein